MEVSGVKGDSPIAHRLKYTPLSGAGILVPLRKCTPGSAVVVILLHGGGFSKPYQPEVNERWQREMAGFFVQKDGLLPDRAAEPLEEIFHVLTVRIHE